MTIHLSKPSRKITLVSVRHVYRCKEHPDWRIERSHITVGESSSDPIRDVWQVWCYRGSVWIGCRTWQCCSEHRTKAAAIKAMTKAIRKATR